MTIARKGYWADLSWPEFDRLDLDRTIAVLPVGAIEQHGPHLPVSVDYDLVEAVVQRSLPLVADHLTVLFLPGMAYGKSCEHAGFPGTLTLSAETLMHLWTEIGESVARAGVNRFVLFNGHGGNLPVMDIVARELRGRHGMLTAVCSWYQFNEAEKSVAAREHAFGIHAGEVETSAVLALKPDLVNLDQARNFPSESETWHERYRFIGMGGAAAKPGWIIGDLNPDGACGDAAAATAEKGEAFLTKAAENFALFLSEFDDFCQRSSSYSNRSGAGPKPGA